MTGPGSRTAPGPGPMGHRRWRAGRCISPTASASFGCRRRKGHLVWSVDLAGQVGIEPPAFGYAITPLVHDGKVIVPVGGKGHAVVALRANNGGVVWQSGDEPANYSSCIPVSVAGNVPCGCLLGQQCRRTGPTTGRELWQYAWGGQYGPLTTTSPLFPRNPFCSMLCHFVVAVTP